MSASAAIEFDEIQMEVGNEIIQILNKSQQSILSLKVLSKRVVQETQNDPVWSMYQRTKLSKLHPPFKMILGL